MNDDEQDWSIGSYPPSEHDDESSVEAPPPLPSKPSSPGSSLPLFPSHRLPTALVVEKVSIFEHVNADVFKGSHLRDRITRHELASFSCIQNTNLDNIANEERGASMIMSHGEAWRLFLVWKAGFSNAVLLQWLGPCGDDGIPSFLFLSRTDLQSNWEDHFKCLNFDGHVFQYHATGSTSSSLQNALPQQTS
jgi:hypothetical protein